MSSLSRRAVIGGAMAYAFSRQTVHAAEIPLKAQATQRGISFGTAAEASSRTDDPAYGALAAQECALITTENALKWDATEPEPGRFDFAEAFSQAVVR